jgi:hypothetical protein
MDTKKQSRDYSRPAFQLSAGLLTVLDKSLRRAGMTSL